MHTHTHKNAGKKSKAVANTESQTSVSGDTTAQFVDNRPESIAQQNLQLMANNSPQVRQGAQLQAWVNNPTIQRQPTISNEPASQPSFPELSTTSSPQAGGVVQRALDPTDPKKDLVHKIGSDKAKKAIAKNLVDYFEPFSNDQYKQFKDMEKTQFFAMLDRIVADRAAAAAAAPEAEGRLGPLAAQAGALADLGGAALNTGEDAAAVTGAFSVAASQSAVLDAGLEGVGGATGGIKDMIEGAQDYRKPGKKTEAALGMASGAAGLYSAAPALASTMSSMASAVPSVVSSATSMASQAAAMIPSSVVEGATTAASYAGPVMSGIAKFLPAPDTMAIASGAAKAGGGVAKIANSRSQEKAIDALKKTAGIPQELTEALTALHSEIGYREGLWQTASGAAEGGGAWFGGAGNYGASLATKGMEAAYNGIPYMGRALASYTPWVDSNQQKKEQAEQEKGGKVAKMGPAVHACAAHPDWIGQLYAIAIKVDEDYGKAIKAAIAAFPDQGQKTAAENAIK